MAKKKEVEVESPRKYEVLETSYIGDRIYQAGEHVEYEGQPGANLRLLDGQEAYVEPEDQSGALAADLDARDSALNLREEEVAKREKAVDEREQQLDQMIEDADSRAKDLDAREVAVAAKEALAK